MLTKEKCIVNYQPPSPEQPASAAGTTSLCIFQIYNCIPKMRSVVGIRKQKRDGWPKETYMDILDRPRTKNESEAKNYRSETISIEGIRDPETHLLVNLFDEEGNSSVEGFWRHLSIDDQTDQYFWEEDMTRRKIIDGTQILKLKNTIKDLFSTIMMNSK